MSNIKVKFQPGDFCYYSNTDCYNVYKCKILSVTITNVSHAYSICYVDECNYMREKSNIGSNFLSSSIEESEKVLINNIKVYSYYN